MLLENVFIFLRQSTLKESLKKCTSADTEAEIEELCLWGSTTTLIVIMSFTITQKILKKYHRNGRQLEVNY